MMGPASHVLRLEPKARGLNCFNNSLLLFTLIYLLLFNIAMTNIVHHPQNHQHQQQKGPQHPTPALKSTPFNFSSLDISRPVDPGLLSVLKNAAGIYVSDDARRKALDGLNVSIEDVKNTVVITGCNYGYLNHLHNLKCFLDRIGYKVLVFAMDAKAHDYIQNHMSSDGNIFSYYLLRAGNATSNGGETETVKEASTEFRSSQFHIITNLKMEGVLRTMEAGYNALFIDPDVAVLRDPISYIFWRNVDYVHSLNWICPHSDKWDFYKSEEEGNTGFYFVRANEKTIKLWRHSINIAPQYPGVDDQSIFWELIRTTKVHHIKPIPSGCRHYGDVDKHESISNSSMGDNKYIITCHLDGCVFSAGALRGVAFTWLSENLKRKKERAVSVHANYLKGNEVKMRHLQQHKFWITTPDGTGRQFGGKCAPFQQAF